MCFHNRPTWPTAEQTDRIRKLINRRRGSPLGNSHVDPSYPDSLLVDLPTGNNQETARETEVQRVRTALVKHDEEAKT